MPRLSDKIELHWETHALTDESVITGRDYCLVSGSVELVHVIHDDNDCADAFPVIPVVAYGSDDDYFNGLFSHVVDWSEQYVRDWFDAMELTE